MNNISSAIYAVVDAAACASADKQMMVALVQSWHCDCEFSAPVAAAHASSDIVDVLNDFLDKAQTQFDETRQAESNAPLGDWLARDNKGLEKLKVGKAELSTALTAEKADLAVSEKSLPAENASRNMLPHSLGEGGQFGVCPFL